MRNVKVIPAKVVIPKTRALFCVKRYFSLLILYLM